MKIEVSNAEILDKFSILMIKGFRIEDEDKIRNIQKEIDVLLPIADELTEEEEVYSKYLELIKVNEELWEIEDEIREYEKRQHFEGRFIQLARLVYITNDRRAEIKKEINLLTGSNLIEEKSYKEYK